jgi:hypothetical protein
MENWRNGVAFSSHYSINTVTQHIQKNIPLGWLSGYNVTTVQYLPEVSCLIGIFPPSEKSRTNSGAMAVQAPTTCQKRVLSSQNFF